MHAPFSFSRTHRQRPVQYQDRHGRVWHVAEVARLGVVTPSMDGPNPYLVIRFEREGEERFVRWISDADWRTQHTLDELFAKAAP